MSAKKRGSAAKPLYEATMFGDSAYLGNSAVNRERVIGQALTRMITSLAVNRFKWEGLPKSIDPRFLEMQLFYHGLAVCYWDHDYDKLLAVRGSGIGYVNMLDNPVSFNVVAPGTQIMSETMATFVNKSVKAFDPARHWELSKDELKAYAVPVWANYVRKPDLDMVNIYASRLATVDRTLEINTKNARRNKVLRGSENLQLSMVNFARSADQGDEVLQVTGPMQDMEFIDTIDLGILPDSYEKLHILRTRWWNECMGLLGIDNANQDKKERLVAAEVTANESQTDSMRYVNLQARQYAAEMINHVYGTNITVEFNTEVEAMAQLVSGDNEDGVNNGDIHNTAE